MLRKPPSKPTHNVVVKIDGIWREIGAAWWAPDTASMSVKMHPLVDLSRLAILAPNETIRIFPRTKKLAPKRTPPAGAEETVPPDDDFDPDSYQGLPGVDMDNDSAPE